MRQHVTTCEVCQRTAPTGAHPCMFGAASGLCSCWRDVPCQPRADRKPTRKEATR